MLSRRRPGSLAALVLTLAACAGAEPGRTRPPEEPVGPEEPATTGGTGGMAAGGRGGAPGAGGNGGAALGGRGGAAGEGGTGGGGGRTSEPDGGIGPDAGPGAPDAGVSPSDAIGDRPPPTPIVGARVVVAVGYGGVRFRSLDSGVTWEKTGEDATRGGDDGNLLRSVAFGNGLWVAGGWNKNHTSPDGRSWTTRPHKMGIMQGMAFGNGLFLATELGGAVHRSSDGIAWTRVGTTGVGRHARLLFALGKFYAWGDDKVVQVSSDGARWEKVDGMTSVAYCGGDAVKARAACFGNNDNGDWGDGVALRPRWLGKIDRSPDGKTWKQVLDYPGNAFDTLAFGPAAP